jgi:hypothetical protein
MSKYQIDQEGTYHGVVTEPMYDWLSENEKTGSRYIRVPVKIDTEGAQNGKVIEWYGYLGEDVGRDGKTKTQRTVETLENCFGIDWDWNNINFAGKEAEVVVELEDRDGKIRSKVKWLNNPNMDRVSGGKSPEEIEAKKAEAKAKAAEIAKELAASMPRRAGKPVVAPTRAAVASKPASRPLPPVKTIDEDGDEIPF